MRKFFLQCQKENEVVLEKEKCSVLQVNTPDQSENKICSKNEGKVENNNS